MFSSLLPRETSFFDFFERHALITVKGTREFLELVSTAEPREPRARRIKEFEHEADVVTHQCVEAIHKTFITPIDRDDIHRLISRMDDVMDFVEAAADRIALYELAKMRPDVIELTIVLMHASEEVAEALKDLRDLKNAKAIIDHCIAVNRLENEGDVLLRSALARLFREEKDPIVVIKWKEIFEHLESATDRCEDVANIIEGLILEQG
jgi:uncharacterized protein